jgi:hypothetical protein
VSQIKLTTSQLKSVQEYCKLNNIEDIDKFISKCFTEGYNINKYGLLGSDSEKVTEIEVIKEIRVEVPVEVIKEVEVVREVIKEVPVEVIKEVIKEVPVETIKEVEVIKYVDREVIKEVRVEVPVTNLDNICDKPEPIIVEKIVEVIKEVPVEKIVEKIVEVEKPNDKVLLLQETLQTLKKELSLKNTKIEELENKNKQLESIEVNQKAVYLKGSNLNETM